MWYKCKYLGADGTCQALNIEMEFELAGPEATYGYMKCITEVHTKIVFKEYEQLYEKIKS